MTLLLGFLVGLWRRNAELVEIRISDDLEFVLLIVLEEVIKSMCRKVERLSDQGGKGDGELGHARDVFFKDWAE